jgi:hypothetical protein
MDLSITDPGYCSAAQKLAQRAEDLWAQLNSTDVNQYLGLTEWPVSNPATCTFLSEYIGAIVRDTTINSMRADDLYDVDKNRSRYAPAANYKSTASIYQQLLPAQLILTPHFWKEFAIVASHRQFLNHRLLQPSVNPVSGTEWFDPDRFHSQFCTAVIELKNHWIGFNIEVPILQNGPLVMGLTDDEYRFLPLWAGGLDDGTGGVYQSEIPDADRGFPIGPGPSFHTGETIGDDDDDGRSTIDGAATVATGTGTVTMTEGRSVIAAPPQTEGSDAGTLNIAISRVSLTAAQYLSAASAEGENWEFRTTTQEAAVPASSADEFDWSISDMSDDLDNFDDFDEDDFDEDDNDDNNDGAVNDETNNNDNANADTAEKDY